MYCGVALPGSRGVAHRKVSTHRFCAAKLLALKSIGFLMTGKKRRAGMRPHFKRFFRSMAQKDLLLSDACLPLCGRSLLFFCRRFLFQIKRKCRNAGSVYHLIIVRSEGRNQLSTIQLYYNFVSATPISDSRKGCPYEVRGLKFVRIFERRAMFSTTVNNRHFENSVPLARHRCVESPHPTNSAPIKLYRFRGRLYLPALRTFFTIHFYLLL